MKHCYGCTNISDRDKLREFKNGNQLNDNQYQMIKFEGYVAINSNNNKSNTASYNRKLDQLYAYIPMTVVF